MSNPVDASASTSNTFKATLSYDILGKHTLNWEAPLELPPNNLIRITILDSDVRSPKAFKVMNTDINNLKYSLASELTYNGTYKIFATYKTQNNFYESNKLHITSEHWPAQKPIMSHEETDTHKSTLTWVTEPVNNPNNYTISIIAESDNDVMESVYNLTDYNFLLNLLEFKGSFVRLVMVVNKMITIDGVEYITSSEPSDTHNINLEDKPNAPQKLNVMYAKHNLNNRVSLHVSWKKPVFYSKEIEGYSLIVFNKTKMKSLKITIPNSNTLFYDYFKNNDEDGIDNFGDTLQFSVQAYYTITADNHTNFSFGEKNDPPAGGRKDELQLIQFHSGPTVDIHTHDYIIGDKNIMFYFEPKLNLPNDTGRDKITFKNLILDKTGIIYNNNNNVDQGITNTLYRSNKKYMMALAISCETIRQTNPDDSDAHIYSNFPSYKKTFITEPLTSLTTKLTLKTSAYNNNDGYEYLVVDIEPSNHNFFDDFNNLLELDLEVKWDHQGEDHEPISSPINCTYNGKIITVPQALTFTNPSLSEPVYTKNLLTRYRVKFPSSQIIDNSDANYLHNLVFGTNLPDDFVLAADYIMFEQTSTSIASVNTNITNCSSSPNEKDGEATLTWTATSNDYIVTFDPLGPKLENVFKYNNVHRGLVTGLTNGISSTATIESSWVSGLTQTDRVSVPVQSIYNNSTITDVIKYISSHSITISGKISDVPTYFDINHLDVVCTVSKNNVLQDKMVQSINIFENIFTVILIDMIDDEQYVVNLTPKAILNNVIYISDDTKTLSHCYSRVTPSNMEVNTSLLDNTIVNITVGTSEYSSHIDSNCNITRTVWDLTNTIQLSTDFNVESALNSNKKYSATDSKHYLEEFFVNKNYVRYSSKLTFTDPQNNLDGVTVIIVAPTTNGPSSNSFERINIVKLADSPSARLTISNTEDLTQRTLKLIINEQGDEVKLVLLITSDNGNTSAKLFLRTDFTGYDVIGNNLEYLMTIKADTKCLLLVSNGYGSQLALYPEQEGIPVEGTNTFTSTKINSYLN
jgi:hypothetical protein